MALTKAWRWFGDKDPVSLDFLKQMGIQSVVTSLHHKKAGEQWIFDEVKFVKDKIESYGMQWNVVESLPVPEGIKTHSKNYDQFVENYILSLKALSENNIKTVCYNFMPVLDWARTDINYELANGGVSMLFDYVTFAAFDIYILKRPNATNDYSDEIQEKAEELFEKMPDEEREKLAYNIIVLTQGFINGNTTDSKDYKAYFLHLLEQYADIDSKKLRSNLNTFLNDIIPYADKYNISMAIHPDDPPFPLLGLPRIVSTTEDLKWIFDANPSVKNGLTLCAGSLSVGVTDVCDIATQFASRIKFAHLRNNEMIGYRSFYESGHKDGIVNMPKLIKILLDEQKRRLSSKRNENITIRPDHGIKILHDYELETNPGYPLYGRMKGLAEIMGMENAIESFWAIALNDLVTANHINEIWFNPFSNFEGIYYQL